MIKTFQETLKQTNKKGSGRNCPCFAIASRQLLWLAANAKVYTSPAIAVCRLPILAT
jgi:hypothetical protein